MAQSLLSGLVFTFDCA